MKIHGLSFSELKKSLETQALVLDLDFKSNNDLFRTQKVFSSRSKKFDNRFDSKQRIMSASSNRGQNGRDNNAARTRSLRPKTGNSNTSRKGQTKTLEAQDCQMHHPTATNRFWKGMQVTRVKQEDIFLQLSKQIKLYFATIITDEQKSETLEQLKLLLNILQKEPDPNLVFLQLQKLQFQLSRFLKHRICHLYFYVVYYKFYMCFSNEPLQKQLKILTLAEYHARCFYFRKVALLICIEIQQKLVKMNNLDESRRYAIKSLKLAILNNDRYQEIKMLEYIGVLKYYEGVLNQNGTNLLTEQERIGILKLYNEEEEIPKIFQFLENDPTKRKKTEDLNVVQDEGISTFEKDKMYFNEGENFIKSNVPNKNLKRFNRNFHAIAKKLSKTNTVKQTIKKVADVGQVKKFIGKQNYITFHPQLYSFKNKFQNQVFVTHKKYGEIERTRKFVNKELPSIILSLGMLISTEISENRGNIIKRDSRDPKDKKRTMIVVHS